MRVGITGAQSTGKSTLLNDLTQLSIFQDYTVCSGLTRTLAKQGFAINEAGDDDTQLAVMNQHRNNLVYENMLTDRTALDGLVYTAWLHSQGKISEKVLTMVEEIFDSLIDNYDIVFYIKPEFDLEDDGERSNDLNFRDDIAELFEDFIEHLNLDVVLLTGSREQRVKQVIDTMKSMQK